VVVSYPPGGKSLAHRHAASAFIYAYVLSGPIRSQVGNDPAKVYHVGEGFYETPGSHHGISENASDKDAASLLAVFVVDSKDDPLTISILHADSFDQPPTRLLCPRPGPPWHFRWACPLKTPSPSSGGHGFCQV
jgi:uncharacterized RmlC-like cupin family protein